MISIICFCNKCKYEFFIKEYEKRCNLKIKWIYLKNCDKHNDEARNIESKLILPYINEKTYTILLDERGKELDNFELSKTLFSKTNVTFIIGGAYGVNDLIRMKVNFVWKLSSLVFPHELVQLILMEQIYRSLMINNNHPYHHV